MRCVKHRCIHNKGIDLNNLEDGEVCLLSDSKCLTCRDRESDWGAGLTNMFTPLRENLSESCKNCEYGVPCRVPMPQGDGHICKYDERYVSKYDDGGYLDRLKQELADGKIRVQGEVLFE